MLSVPHLSCFLGHQQRNKEILINSLIKNVYLYKDKIEIVFYPTNDVEERSFNDGNGGKGGGTTGDNSGNADNNEKNGGSLTASSALPSKKQRLDTIDIKSFLAFYGVFCP